MRSFQCWKDVFCVVDASYRIYSLGDAAITVDWGLVPTPGVHACLISLHDQLQDHPFPGFLESVPAYVTLTVYFNPLDSELQSLVGAGDLSAWISEHISVRIADLQARSTVQDLIHIPVCYDPVFGPDQSEVARHCVMEIEDLIELHASVPYRVYMIGFVPGFPYLGMTDPRLDVPRKKTPVMKVAVGSVAIAGRQTGIYPLSTPGGWQIIGRTPIRLFDPAKTDPFLLKAGMQVKFDRIDRTVFEKLNRS